MSLSLQARTAVEVPSQALGFYRRHPVLIVGISLVPGLERFVSVQTDLPGPLPVVMETLTLLARVLLIGLIVRLAFGRESTGDSGHPARFLRERWPSLMLQAAMLGGLVMVFDVIPEQIIRDWIPSGGEDLYTAVLLLIKNPTVIAFTFVWMVLAARQVVTYTPAEPAVHDRRPRTPQP
ncbi:hypothetical protein [Actinomadura rugatobispora]|uniref:Transmembrane protein n=1 Tax=Actinomadura rugatobispora TaxID=1994 RepID=A0ABW0ZW79_9ACTN|nr:hypothetical protein GCM10010200_096680 [Actinomadura rugatobispora]